MFKYANYDLIVEDNGNLKYIKKDGLGNQEVIKFIVGGFQVINVYWERINGRKIAICNYIEKGTSSSYKRANERIRMVKPLRPHPAHNKKGKKEKNEKNRNI